MDVLCFFEKSQQRNNLDCFPKSHFISQNSINPKVIQGYHPVETLHLIAFQMSVFQEFWLLYCIILRKDRLIRFGTLIICRVFFAENFHPMRKQILRVMHRLFNQILEIRVVKILLFIDFLKDFLL